MLPNIYRYMNEPMISGRIKKFVCFALSMDALLYFA